MCILPFASVVQSGHGLFHFISIIATLFYLPISQCVVDVKFCIFQSASDSVPRPSNKLGD